jgi:hypothetical protein
LPDAPPPAALVLASASYDFNGPSVMLEFDRAIDIAGLDGAQISVNDGAFTGLIFAATGPAMLVDPQTVEIDLVSTGPSAGIDVRLTASAASGIVAVNDGGTWPGVMNLVLPFP